MDILSRNRKYIPYILIFGIIIFTISFPRFVRENEMILIVTVVPIVVLSYFFCRSKEEQ